MREPPARVRFIGHPLVATPICGLCAVAVFLWMQNPDAFILGLVALPTMIWTFRASTVMGRHRAWPRAWDSMAEPLPSRPVRTGPRIAAALIAVAVVGGFALAETSGLTMGSGDAPAVLGMVILTAVVVATIVLWRAIARRVVRPRATPAAPAVVIRVRQPVMPVPTMTDAYGALPSHCWDVLGR